MKIVLIAGGNSPHTVKWANGLRSRGHDVYLFSQHGRHDLLHKDIKVYELQYKGVFGYYLNVPFIKKEIKKIEPDILNVHYASGYGTTARLVNFKPYLLSVWGSDVYDFPYKNKINEYIIKKNIRATDFIASTSVAMAQQVKALVLDLKNEIFITPFGVDVDFFSKKDTINFTEKGDEIIIGTVKSLGVLYGIDTLIKSFKIVLDTLVKEDASWNSKLKLRIIGDGNEKLNLERLVKELDLSKNVEFFGRVDVERVPEYLHEFDIYVALSRAESFGVAIVEASAAGKPVIVTDVGGLPEVVINEVTGLIVEKESCFEAANAIIKLIKNKDLRKNFGLNGYNYVKSKFDWNDNLDLMIDVYKEIIRKYKK